MKRKRKTTKTSTYEELNAALLQWKVQIRSDETPVSGPIVAALKRIDELVRYPEKDETTLSGKILLKKFQSRITISNFFSLNTFLRYTF